jgi:hypothetical protein
MNQYKINEQSQRHISDIHKSFSKDESDPDPDSDSESNISYDSTHDSNIIFANLNKSLYDLFTPSSLSSLSQPKTPIINEWIPPAKPGLSNCQAIIPNYYPRKYNTILDIDYLTIIKDDIKNCRVLNGYQMEYIQSLNTREKQELFVLFNQCVQMFNDYVLFEKPEIDDHEASDDTNSSATTKESL